MATYIENDVQNVFIDLRNEDALAITFIYYGVLRTILRDCLNDA